MAAPKAQTLQQRLGFVDDDLKRTSHDDIIIWAQNNAFNIINHLIDFNSFKESEIEAVKNQIIGAYNNKYYSREGERVAYKEHDSRNKANFKPEEIQFAQQVPKRSPIKIINTEWEYLIRSFSQASKTGYQSPPKDIGFIDLKIDFAFSRLDIKKADIDYGRPPYFFPTNSNASFYSDTPYPFEWTQLMFNTSLFVEVKTKMPTLGELFRQLNIYRNYCPGLYLIVCPDDKHSQTITEQGYYFLKYDPGLFNN